jgi:Amino acid synthesis
MNLRKLSLTKETIFADAGRPISQPITRAVAVAVVDNPFCRSVR